MSDDIRTLSREGLLDFTYRLMNGVRDSETELKALQAQVVVLRTALQLVLDQVDYTKNACSLREMVGAVLDITVLDIAHNALSEPTPADVQRIELALKLAESVKPHHTETSYSGGEKTGFRVISYSVDWGLAEQFQALDKQGRQV